jgi:NadR type nicotinamide-nucleotide adenylyltransferase
VLGAESTGTTTLSKKLADHYHTTWVPEYGRYYTEALNDMGHEWHSQEFAHIAELQQQMEQQLAGESNGLLICDTNAFATRLWHDRYVGAMSDKVDEIAQKDRVDLYILTGDEIPFVQDGIRDGEHIRHDMHGKFIAELAQTDTPYIQVRGSVAGRLKAATAAIDTLLQKRVTI